MINVTQAVTEAPFGCGIFLQIMRSRIRPKRQIMRQDAADFTELCGNYAANFSSSS